jgi:hypothetical protein
MTNINHRRLTFIPIGLLSLALSPIFLFISVHNSPLLRQTQGLELATNSGFLDLVGVMENFQLNRNDFEGNSWVARLDSICRTVDSTPQKSWFGFYLILPRNCSYGQFVGVVDMLAQSNFYVSFIGHGDIVVSHSGFFMSDTLEFPSPTAANEEITSSARRALSIWQSRNLYILEAFSENKSLLIPLFLWTIIFYWNIHRSLHHYKRLRLTRPTTTRWV